MKNLLLTAAVVFYAGYATPVFSQKAEIPKFIANTEGIKEYSLSNGMKVLLISDASQSNAVINIVYNVGSKHEGYGEKGMAHLLEHMLFKSTKKLGDIKKCCLIKVEMPTGQLIMTEPIITKFSLLMMIT